MSKKRALRYPLEMIDSNSDYLQIRVMKYRAPGLGQGVTSGSFSLPTSQNMIGTSLGTILLPIPEGLTDFNGVTWDTDSLNGVSAAIVQAGTNVVDAATAANPGAFDNIFSSAVDAAGAGFQALQQEVLGFGEALNGPGGSDIRNALKTKFIAGAANLLNANVNAESILSRTTGQVLNPNMELLFKGVQLRSFGFTFKLTPRSRAESQEIKGIINTFKRRMAAKRSTDSSSSGVFISSPDVFQLEFKSGGRKHPFLFSMKKCALVDMSVSYSDQGPYMTYEDASPVAMTMNLKFRELSPVYEEDYADNIDGGVGF